MRKKIIAISFIVSWLMVVIHEMIPHHHHDLEDDIELFSHHHPTHQHGENSETSHAHHFPFPVHHHVSASEGFEAVRLSTDLEREIYSAFSFFVPDYLVPVPDAVPPESAFYPDFPTTFKSLPFIISPNAMRGSPFFA